MDLSNMILELILLGFMGMIGLFSRRVLGKLDELHQDISKLAVNHGERIAGMEAAIHFHGRRNDKWRS